MAPTLLEVIAGKTGYPVEMLELDMALDADLGIDSIKRVEILSALQEELPGAPADQDRNISAPCRRFGQIVDFLASVSGADGSCAKPQKPSAAVSGRCGIERKC